MEYFTLSPVQFSIWSSDSKLISSPLFVTASPKSPVSRLLQYVHWQLYVRNTENLLPPAQYHFKHLGKIVDLTTLCSSFDSGYTGIVKLELDVWQEIAGLSISLDYTENEFLTTNVEFQINTLSMDKILSVIKYDIPLSSSVMDLCNIACELLNRYERTSVKNICSVKNHPPSDLVAFQIAENTHPMKLHADAEEKYKGIRLKDLLGYDFVPSHSAHCSIMFRSRHGQHTDGVTIEFISESTLTMNKMNVTMETTVEEVKEFICSVYGHTLRLAPADVKLIYGGQLVQDRSYSGEPSRILEYVSDTNHTKFHVKITQEYSNPGPGFWSELFSSTDRFMFNPRSPYVALDNMYQNNSPTYPGANDLHPHEYPIPVLNFGQDVLGQQGNSVIVDQLHSNEVSSSQETINFITEDGKPIKRTEELYEKVLVHGASYFVPRHAFEPFVHELSVSGHLIRICSSDLLLLPDRVLLKPNVVRTIENILGTRIEKQRLNIAQNLPMHGVIPAVSNNQSQREDRSFLHAITASATRIAECWQVILLSLFLMSFNIGMLILLFVCYSIGVFSLPRFVALTFFSFILVNFSMGSLSAVMNLWLDFFFGHDKPTDREVEVVRTAIPEAIDYRFCAQIQHATNVKVISDVLISKLNSDPELVHDLCTVYRVDPSVSVRFLVPCVLQRCHAPEYRDNDPVLLHRMFKDIMDNIVGHLNNPTDLSLYEQEVLKLFRIHLWYTRPQGSYLYYIRPLYICYTICRFCSSFLHAFIPDPAKDSILTSIFKNVVLSILLFFPSFQLQFEDILAERHWQQSAQPQPQQQQELNHEVQAPEATDSTDSTERTEAPVHTAPAQEQLETSVPELEIIPSASPVVASGRELHHFDHEDID